MQMFAANGSKRQLTLVLVLIAGVLLAGSALGYSINTTELFIQPDISDPVTLPNHSYKKSTSNAANAANNSWNYAKTAGDSGLCGAIWDVTTTLKPAYLNEAEIVEELKFAMQAWNNVPDSQWSFDTSQVGNADSLDHDCTDDRQDIYWYAESGTTLAVTTGPVIDTFNSGYPQHGADIGINATPPFSSSWTTNGTPGPTLIDLQGVMVHEFGHAMGMGHSTVSSATMWPTYHSLARSLDADDSRAAQYLYASELLLIDESFPVVINEGESFDFIITARFDGGAEIPADSELHLNISVEGDADISILDADPAWTSVSLINPGQTLDDIEQSPSVTASDKAIEAVVSNPTAFVGRDWYVRVRIKHNSGPDLDVRWRTHYLDTSSNNTLANSAEFTWKAIGDLNPRYSFLDFFNGYIVIDQQGFPARHKVLPILTPSKRLLLVNSAGASAVPIDSSTGSTVAHDGTTTYAKVVQPGTEVRLYAPDIAPGGENFSSWTGCVPHAVNGPSYSVCQVTVNDNSTVTANYTPPGSYALFVTSSFAQAVSISSTTGHGGITDYQKVISSGETVQLEAPATSNGATFVDWTGCTSSTGTSCSVTPSASTTVKANYTGSWYYLSVNSSGASGVNISSPSGHGGTTDYFVSQLVPGQMVNLEAPATSGSWVFTGWTNCTIKTGTTCQLKMIGDTTVTANYYIPGNHTLTVNSSGASGVSISSSTGDGGITSYQKSRAPATTIVLEAPVLSGTSTFNNWSGCTSTFGNTCSVIINSNTTVTANYIPPYVLHVRSTGASNVSITSNSGYSGTTDYDLLVASGTVVDLFAPLTSGGANFNSWSGCSSIPSEKCVLTVNSETTVTANYLPAGTATLQVNTTGSVAAPVAVPITSSTGHGGTTHYTMTMPSNEPVVLEAPATFGSSFFNGWDGCIPYSNTTTCTISVSDYAVVSAFYVVPGYTLQVKSTGTSAVSITSSTGHGGTTNYARIAVVGGNVALEAPSTSGGYTFTNWSGCTTATDTSCSVTMSTHITVTVNYDPPICYALTLGYTGSGTAPVASPVNSTACSAGTYSAGENIGLTASADAGWAVSGWTGTSTDASTAATNQVTMPASSHVVSVTYAAAGACPAGSVRTPWLDEDMESGVGDWTHFAIVGDDEWTWGETAANSPTHAWHGGSGLISLGASDQSLVSPPAVVPATATNVVLSFYNKRDFELFSGTNQCLDVALLEYSTNGAAASANWQQVQPSSFLTDAYNGEMDGRFNPLLDIVDDAWCGVQDWISTEVDLSGLEGQTLHFRFRIGTDNEDRGDGWHIDDVKVSGCSPGVLIFKNGFESP